MTTLGTKLRKLCESRNLNLNALSFELDIPQATLFRIESDINEKVSFANMQKISEFFGVDLNYFVDEKVNNVVKKNKNGFVVNNNGSVVNNFNEKKSTENVTETQNKTVGDDEN